MKIGLITKIQVTNYGTVLQAFATKHLLEQMGAECSIIQYVCPNKWQFSQGVKRSPLRRRIYQYFFPLEKNKKLAAFRKKYLSLTKKYSDIDALEAEDWSDYDAFIAGSDQIWNYRYDKADKAFMLSFIHDDKPKFALASSFATNSIPEELRKKYTKYLSKFKTLSVREKNGVNIINQELGIGNPVKVLLDPTLLLNKEDWMHSLPRSNFKKHRPYIVLYLLKYAFEPRPYIFDVVKNFQQRLNCNIIALAGYEKPETACGLKMQDASSSSVEEFIDIMANADLIVTSSFHGTAFAINFGVPLISIVPDGNADDRQTTLLNSVGCKQCIIHLGENIKDINPSYNAEEEQAALEEIRKDNLQYIKEKITNKI